MPCLLRFSSCGVLSYVLAEKIPGRFHQADMPSQGEVIGLVMDSGSIELGDGVGGGNHFVV